MEEDIRKTGPVGLQGADKTGQVVYDKDYVTKQNKEKEYAEFSKNFDKMIERDKAMDSLLKRGQGTQAANALYNPISDFGVGDILRSQGYGNSKYDKEVNTLSEVLDINQVRAQSQSGLAQLGAGLGKAAVLAGTTFLTDTLGFLWGIGAAIFGDKGVAGLSNNSFMEAMDEINQWSEEALPNYYSNQEKLNQARGQWLSNLGTANFWGDMMIKNAGFAIGSLAATMVPFGPVGVLAKGAAKAASGISKFAFKNALKVGGAGKLSALRKMSGIKACTSSIVSAVGSAYNEGNIEAFHAARDWSTPKFEQAQSEYDEMIKNIDLYYGGNEKLKEQAAEELEAKKAAIEKSASEIANTTLIGNLPILTISEMLMFAKLYARGWKNYKSLAGNLKDATLTSSRSKAGKVLAGAKNVLSEGFEEINQAAVSTASQYYGDTLYDHYSKSIDSDESEQVDGYWNTFGKAIADTYSDPNSWQEFFAGAFMGALGIPHFRSRTNAKGEKQSPITLEGGIYSALRDYQQEWDQENELAAYLNSRIKDPKFAKMYSSIVAHNAYEDVKTLASQAEDRLSFEDAQHRQLLNDIIAMDNAGKLSEFSSMIEGFADDLSDEDLKDIIQQTTSIVDVKHGNKIVKEKSGPFAAWAKIGSEGQIEADLGTEESKKRLIEKLQENNKSLSNTIAEYLADKEEVTSKWGDTGDRDQVAALTWLHSLIRNSKGRLGTLHKEFSKASDYIKMGYRHSIEDLKREMQEKEKKKPLSEEKKKEYQDAIETLQKKLDELEEFKSEIEEIGEKGPISDAAYIEKAQKAEELLATLVALNKNDLLSRRDRMSGRIVKMRNEDGTSTEKLERGYLTKKRKAQIAFLNKVHDIAKNHNNDPAMLKKAREKFEKDIKNIEALSDYRLSPLLEKLQDITTLGEAIVKYRGEVFKYANPAEYNKMKKAAEEAEIKKQEEKRKKRIEENFASATDMASFREAMNNIESDEEKKSTLEELVKNGNPLAKSYQELAAYEREVRQALNSLGLSEQTKENALSLLQDSFEHSESLEDAANPDSVWINNPGRLETNYSTVQEGAAAFAAAQYAALQALYKANNSATYKTLFKDEYKKAPTKVENMDPALGTNNTTVGNSGTTAIPAVSQTAPVTAAVESTKEDTFDDVLEENDKRTSTIGKGDSPEDVKSSNDSSTPYWYWSPVIPEMGIDESLEGDFRDFDIVKQEQGLDFTALYAELRDSFSYINEGNLKVGDEIGFMINPSFDSDNNNTEPTIFMIDYKTGRILGSLPSSEYKVKRHKGLSAFIATLKEQYRNTPKETIEKNGGKFISAYKVPVRRIMLGKVLTDKEQRSMASLQVDAEGNFTAVKYGVMVNGTLVTPGVDPENVIGFNSNTYKNGRIYTLVPTADGRYIPMLNYTKHLNAEEFNLSDAAIANTPIGKELIAILSEYYKVLADSSTSTEVKNKLFSDINQKLQTLLYMPDVIIRPRVTSGGFIGLVIAKKLRDANGNFIEETNAKGTFVAQDSQFVVLAKTTPDGSQVSSEEEFFKSLQDALYHFNIRFQVDTQSINDAETQEKIVRSGILATNLTSLKTKGGWFITDYIDADGNTQTAITPKATGKLFASNLSSSIVPLNGLYYYDTNTHQVYNNQGDNITSSVAHSAELLYYAAWAFQNYGDNTIGYNMIDNCIYIQAVGKVLNRSELRYLNDEEANAFFAKLSEAKQKQSEWQRSRATGVLARLEEDQKKVHKDKTDSEYYYITEADGAIHAYKRVHSVIGDNYLLSDYEKKQKAAIYNKVREVLTNATHGNVLNQEILLKGLEELKEANAEFNISELIERIKNINFSQLGSYDMAEGIIANTIIKANKEKRNSSSIALKIGSAVDSVVRDFFNAERDENGKAKIENINRQEEYLSPEAFASLIERLRKIEDTINSRGERFLANNIVLFGKWGNIRVAGEVDILSVDKDGNFRIYDVKTSSRPFTPRLVGGEYVNSFDWTIGGKYTPGGSRSFFGKKSPKDYYTDQLSVYKTLFETKYGLPIKGLAIMPFQVVYEKEATESGKEKHTGRASEIIASDGIPVVARDMRNIMGIATEAPVGLQREFQKTVGEQSVKLGTNKVTLTNAAGQKEVYTVDGLHIYDSTGTEVMTKDSPERRKIYGNLAISQGRAKRVFLKDGSWYLVNDRGQIMNSMGVILIPGLDPSLENMLLNTAQRLGLQLKSVPKIATSSNTGASNAVSTSTASATNNSTATDGKKDEKKATEASSAQPTSAISKPSDLIVIDEATANEVYKDLKQGSDWTTDGTAQKEDNSKIGYVVQSDGTLHKTWVSPLTEKDGKTYYRFFMKSHNMEIVVLPNGYMYPAPKATVDSYLQSTAYSSVEEVLTQEIVNGSDVTPFLQKESEIAQAWEKYANATPQASPATEEKQDTETDNAGSDVEEELDENVDLTASQEAAQIEIQVPEDTEKTNDSNSDVNTETEKPAEEVTNRPTSVKLTNSRGRSLGSTLRRRKPRLRKASSNIKVWDKQKEISWLNKVLPQLSEQERLLFTKGLIKVAKSGETAWGMVVDGIMVLSDIAAEGTAYHEAFHIVFNYLLDGAQREQLLQEAWQRWGNLDDISLEEELAEAFREYTITQDASIWKKIGNAIINFFKSLFTKTQNWQKVQPHSYALFQAINNGKFAEQQLNVHEGVKLGKAVDKKSNVTTQLITYMKQVLGDDLVIDKEEFEKAQWENAQYQISKGERKAFTERLVKSTLALSEEQQQDILNYLDELKDKKHVNAVFRWVMAGSVIVGKANTEDNYKVEKALKLIDRHKLNPKDFSNPMEIINQYDTNEEEDAKFDPMTKPYLSNGKKIGNVTVYNMEDTEDAAKDFCETVMQKFYKTSPWCLMSWGNHGEWVGSKYWNLYNAAPRKVAFDEKGKPIAFYSSDHEEGQWWDETDHPHEGIPTTMKIEGDKLGRSAVYVLDEEGNKIGKPEHIFKGSKKEGVYEEYDSVEDNEPFLHEERKHHKLTLRIQRDNPWGVSSRVEFEEGQPIREIYYDSNGQISTVKTQLRSYGYGSIVMDRTFIGDVFYYLQFGDFGITFRKIPISKDQYEHMSKTRTLTQDFEEQVAALSELPFSRRRKDRIVSLSSNKKPDLKTIKIKDKQEAAIFYKAAKESILWGNKVGKKYNHVFTANNFYIFEITDPQAGEVRPLYTMPVVGNEEKIRIIKDVFKDESIDRTTEFVNGLINCLRSGKRDNTILSNYLNRFRMGSSSEFYRMGERHAGGGRQIPKSGRGIGEDSLFRSDVSEGEIEVLGYEKDGKIYLNPDKLNSNTAIHEYTHLFDKVVKQTNPNLWNKGKDLMKQTSIWQEVLNDELYGEEWKQKGYSEEAIEELVASEVHSRLAGENAESIFSELEKRSQKGIIDKLKKWLKDFWYTALSPFTNWNRNDIEKISLDDFVKMPLSELMKGTNPNDVIRSRKVSPLHSSLTQRERRKSDWSRISQDTKEMQDIKEKAIANGTFMKAPNGNPTNLTERQWLQVRTKAFKDWFGDWEIFQKLQNATVIWGHPGTGKTWMFKQGRKDIIDFDSEFKAKLTDKYGGIKKAKQALGKEAYNAELDRMFDEARRLAQSTGRKLLVSDTHFLESRVQDLDAVTNISNEEFIERSHQRNEFDDDKKLLWKEDINTAMSKIPSEKIINHTGYITDLLGGSNVSKVVDENGEPLVVYHGSNTTITEFNYAGEREWSFGFFFTSDRQYAESVASAKKGKIIIPAFLNIKDPVNTNTEIVSKYAEGILIEEGTRKSDGIIGHDKYTGEFKKSEGTEFVVLRSNQIKSATDNIGEFSTENDDIRFRKVSPLHSSLTQREKELRERRKSDWSRISQDTKEILQGMGVTEEIWDSLPTENRKHSLECLGIA